MGLAVVLSAGAMLARMEWHSSPTLRDSSARLAERHAKKAVLRWFVGVTVSSP